jgi:hypothetical protein
MPASSIPDGFPSSAALVGRGATQRSSAGVVSSETRNL